jgi:hypothetical protein
MNYNPNYYAILTADVRYCPDLSAQEKILFAEITALASKDGTCFAGNKYFADLYNLTTVTISRQISKLASLGFIKIGFDKEGAKVKKRVITINKNVNGNPIYINKNVNRTINKNVKDNNTSILILNNNNISEQSMALSEYFCSQLEKNGLKPRSEQTKSIYAKTFDSLLQTYSENSLVDIIKFATTNNFWKGICLSASKVKQHAEQLYIQMAGRTNPALDCDRVTDTNVDF